jgi:hypothetical protein
MVLGVGGVVGDGGGDDAVGAARREKSSVFVWEVTSERRE